VAQKRVVWSAAAIADLSAIAEYIARDSEQYASTVVTRVLDTAASLDDLAERGRVVPEVADESVREVFVFSWRLIYRVQRETVAIVAIVHQKQAFAPESARSQRP
jgi:toxin ParE1/3/4